MDNDELNSFVWEKFRDAFRERDQVVVEDGQGRFRFGRLSYDETSLRLERDWLPDVRLDWSEVVFIAHDGFPVQAVQGMSYNQAWELCEKLDTETMRESLERSCKVGFRARHAPGSLGPLAGGGPATFGGGCPFQFGPAYVEELLFPGNNHPDYWGDDDEETLILRAEDGAIMHSFDLDHLFLFDGLQLPHLQVQG